ncbi:MAG TPA: FtsW/RodA/SpoVE family cell cycle protein [Fimbriimonadaceae bacterium]|nr:FtsW/RodA/SpoVE family cell cycle protein [Fimbriimonadaceae bacterium]
MATVPLSNVRNSKAEAISRWDWWLVLAVITLLLFGLMSLFSIEHGGGASQFKKQLVSVAIGVVPFAIFAFVNPEFWKRIANALYCLSVLVLASIFVIGEEIKGARRWIDIGPLQFQPSEIAKLFLILTLATFFINRRDRIDTFSTFALSLLHLALPLALVFKQPHLGASLVLLTIWLSISLAAGVRLRFLVGTVVAALSFLGLAFTIPGVMSDYQRKRVIGMFVDDTKGNTYQPDRAKIAFGVGGLTGTGYLKGQVKPGGFVPEQHNDFIFTVVGEEGGLVGCTLVLAAFGLLFFRLWLIMFRAAEPYYRMIAAGILGLLAFHTIANLGMNVGLLPVVGLWLPLMSSGGTATWLCLALIGLALNVQSRHREQMF